MTTGGLDVQEIANALLPLLRKLHADIRTAVCRAFETADDMAGVADDGPGDTIYAVDKISEELLINGLGPVAARWPLRLVAEGVHGADGEASVVLPFRRHTWPHVPKAPCVGVDGSRASGRATTSPFRSANGVAVEDNLFGGYLANVAPSQCAIKGQRTRSVGIGNAAMDGLIAGVRAAQTRGVFGGGSSPGAAAFGAHTVSTRDGVLAFA